MSSANSIVCEEIFDESSSPSLDEIKAYATKIGIDPTNEPNLLTLAAEGLMKALPPGWKPVLDDKTKSYYYYNNITGKTQWEHPLDDIYRGLVKKKRSESQSQSIGEPNEDATFTRDDLPSLEEPPPISLGARKKDIKLAPINVGQKLLRQKSEERPIASFIQNRKIGLTLSTSFDGKPDKNQESPKRDFKLNRDGNMFLKKGKSSTEDLKESETNEDYKDEKANESEEEADQEDEELDEKEPPKKSILRERSFILDPKLEDDEERKNVRFSLDVEKSLPNFTLPETGNLKVIKANPKDFTKPRSKNDPESSTAISDSEDDSIMKSLDKRVSKKSLLNIQDEEEEIEHNLVEKFREDNENVLNRIKNNADRELESLKKTIWDENNVEITRYRQELQESQKNELERIMISEKNKYEEHIKRELDNLRTEMESRNLGALEHERLRLEKELISAKDEVNKKFHKDLEERHSDFEKSQRLQFEETEKQLSRDLEQHKDELIVSHNAILDQIKKQHQAVLDEIKQDFKSEEKILRKEHDLMITELKKKVNGNLENELTHQTSTSRDSGDERLYEKVRCEKRLLEDKYRCLKDKYLKLKTDVKITLEKRQRKREQSLTNTTGSETEKSNSINKEKSPNRSPTHLKPPLHTKTEINRQEAAGLEMKSKQARTVIIQDHDTSASDRSYKNDGVNYESSEENANLGRGRKKFYSRVKNAGTSRNPLKSKRTPRTCSPVENLRRQLQKLEDLEDQLPPPHAQTDTYHLRYPFTDGQKFEGSSELEFFRHRIHLERDSIKRAKESLRTQKCLFQQRQNDLKLKHGSMARHTLQQLCQEEKDLTDMEVSLHRTRSLLGEKVIRLRHLEQSLQRATAASNEPSKQDEATLSDLSSHSASSGISSSEFATAADGMKTVLRGEHLQESSEIIQSLENLNLEIREIWEVLNQQQMAGNMPPVLPLPMVYPDLGWPVLAGTAAVPAPPSIPTLADRLHNYRQHVALANAQSTVVTHAANQGATTTLVERTRNLRHWLRQAGIDPNADIAPQATL